MENLKSILFYVPNADYGGKEETYRKINRVYTYTLLICMGIFLGILSLMIVSEYKDIPGAELFLSYMSSLAIALLNILPAVLLILLVYFLSGRAWVAYAVTAFIVLGFSVGDYVKIMVRSNPLVASDMKLLLEAGDMASRYTLDFTWRLWVSVAALVIGTAFCVVFMRAPYKNIKVRAIMSVVLVVIMVILYVSVYMSDEIYESVWNEKYDEFNLDIWTSEHKYISRGFIYPFIHSIKDAVTTPPIGYDDDIADQLISGYTYDNIDEDKKVNIISVMLEAYTDLSRFEDLEIAEEVYAPLHRVMEESYSGTLISNTFGGGTTDSERMFLTGYTSAPDINTYINSYVRYLDEQGYYTEGFHAGDGWFYNRENINEYLGFDEYYFLEALEDSDQTDEYFFSEIKELYESRDESVPYFSYNLSFQNHGPYNSGSTGDVEYIKNTGFSDYSYNILNNYLEGIADTSARIEEFVNSFKDDEEPVIIIMFGDHMPWMGDSNSVLIDLGINIDTGTEEGFLNYYSTMYFIWANDAAKEILGNDFVGEGDNMSACFLMPTLFELCSWNGNEMMQVATELYQHVTIVNTATGIYCVDGALTTDPEGEIADLIYNFEIIQYRIMNKDVDSLESGG